MNIDPLISAQPRQVVMMGIAAVLVFAASAAIGMKGLFSIQSATGTPLGPSIRTPQHIATIISTPEPYVPTLNRNPDEDRHSLSLFLVPVDGHSKEQVIPIAKGWRSRDLHQVRLLGGDDKTVWFNAGGSGGVDITTHKLLGAAELRLSPAPPAPRGASKFPLGPEVQDFLSVGVHTSPTEWLALLSPKEAAAEYRAKTRLSPLNRAESVKEMRRFHRAELGPEAERGMREIHALAAVSTDEYFNAAFVRTAAAEAPIRMQGPDSFLMAYSAKPGLGTSLVVARVDATGKPLWRADTGIDHFKLSQIMPGTPSVAFIGTRPPVPGKVAEPILVVVNSETGAVMTTSLWK